MIVFKDMLIDTPYPLLEIEDRGYRLDPSTSECTYCRRLNGYGATKHDARDVVVVRRWRSRSIWAPEADGIASGGWFEWRCPMHAFNGDSSPFAHNAPQHLVPDRRERCDDVTLGTRCPVITNRCLEGRWLCEAHSAGILARIQADDRLREFEDEIQAEIERELDGTRDI